MNLLICIDFQNDFLEGGALEVKGGKDDVKRTIDFIEKHDIDKIICSLDTHTKNQIFHMCYWQNENGENPNPYTIITSEDVINNVWHPVNGNREYVVEYLNYIEKEGKKNLCIWPYHCLIGTTGAALSDDLANIVYKYDNLFIQKGMDLDTEMYGIISPEYDKESAHKNIELLNEIEKYDNIYVAGEAASHCVLESVKQICKHFENKKEVISKITVLKDCISSIPGFEEVTENEFKKLEEMGLKLLNSTEI